MCTHVAFSNISLCFTLIRQWNNEKEEYVPPPFLQYSWSCSGHIQESLPFIKNNQQRKAKKNDKTYPFPRALMFRLNWSPKGILTPKSSDYKSVPQVFSVISGKCQLLMVQEAIIPTQKIGQRKKGRNLVSETRCWKKKTQRENKEAHRRKYNDVYLLFYIQKISINTVTYSYIHLHLYLHPYLYFTHICPYIQSVSGKKQTW